MIVMIGGLNANMTANVIGASQPTVSDTLIGREGLLAVPVMRSEFMPKPSRPEDAVLMPAMLPAMVSMKTILVKNAINIMNLVPENVLSLYIQFQ